jgi:hypothetical protein
MSADDDNIRYALFFQHACLVHLNPLFREYLEVEKEQVCKLIPHVLRQ